MNEQSAPGRSQLHELKEKGEEIKLKVTDEAQSLEQELNNGGASGAVQVVENTGTANGAAQTTEQNKFREIDRLLETLPSIWKGQLCLIALFLNPPLLYVAAYIYWVVCGYRITRRMAKLFNEPRMKPRLFLWMNLLPAVFVPFIFVGYAPPDISLAVMLSFWIWFFYQWRWPIQCFQVLEKHSPEVKKMAVPLRFLASIGFAALFNLTLFTIACIQVYRMLIYGSEQPPASFLVVSGCLFLFIQFMGLHLLRFDIKSMTNFLPGYKAYRDSKREIKVSDDDIIVRYRFFAQIEKWIAQRRGQHSDKKLFYLLAILFAFLIFHVPQTVLEWLGGLAPSVGALATASAGGSGFTFNFLTAFEVMIASVAFVSALVYLSKPTHIGFSKHGMRFLWRHKVFSHNGGYINWNAIKNISMFLPRGKTSPSDQQLVFHTATGDNPAIKLGSVTAVEDRGRILKAIERFAPGIQRDAAVLQSLEPPADHSYTELWLQALSAPPRRERFKPLIDGAHLADGKYQVLGQLGVGGQGTAYLARDVVADKEVVLKEFILPVYVDVAVRKQALERFENEARILKQLDHPQIVKLVDYLVEDHRSYLVLEHIEGKTLKQLVVEKGPLSEEEVRKLALQMCQIFDYLHTLSPPVVHRDFTPDNLILGSDGVLRLVDFNVAQQTESTATGTVVGKHAYLPPEQFRGTPVPQSDLYSMGATLHFLLTGKDPEPISVSHPRKINENVSEAFDLVVAKATAMTLESRYDNSGEIAEELNAFFEGTT